MVVCEPMLLQDFASSPSTYAYIGPEYCNQPRCYFVMKGEASIFAIPEESKLKDEIRKCQSQCTPYFTSIGAI